MNGWQFVASVLGSLAWPTAVVVLALLFRRSVRQLLTGDVKRWKAGPSGLEVEFREILPEIRETVEKGKPTKPAPPQSAIAEAVPASFRDEMLRLAKVSPRTAVLESFQRLEATLYEMVKEKLDPQVLRSLGAPGLADLARREGKLAASAINAINGLSILRNLAAHGADELDYERAVEYIDLILAVLYAIQQQPPTKPAP